jgi:hypothetical protein
MSVKSFITFDSGVNVITLFIMGQNKLDRLFLPSLFLERSPNIKQQGQNLPLG